MVENILLKNEVTIKELELDVTTTPYYILDKVDWGQVQSTHHQYKYINQAGVTVTGTTLETRDVSITGWVIAKTEEQMSERKRMLNMFVNPLQFIEMRYKKYVLEFLPKNSIKYGTAYPENNDIVCKFAIDGFSPNPLFRENTQNSVAAASTKGMFHFPLCINKKDQWPPQIMFGLREPSLIVDIYNSGAVETGMVIVFKASGTVVNPTFINVKTQEYYKVNKILVAGERIVINTNTGEKNIRGTLNGVESNYFRYRDLNSTWLKLRVGDNLFRYDADENIDGLEVYVYFYNRFLEVQECY